MLGPENHLRPLPSIKMTVPGVFPINIQFIKLYKSCEFMRTGSWKVGRHIVRRQRLIMLYNNVNMSQLCQLYRNYYTNSNCTLMTLTFDLTRLIQLWSTPTSSHHSYKHFYNIFHYFIPKFGCGQNASFKVQFIKLCHILLQGSWLWLLHIVLLQVLPL